VFSRKQFPNTQWNRLRDDVLSPLAAELLHDIRNQSDRTLLQVLPFPKLVAAELDSEVWVQGRVGRGLGELPLMATLEVCVIPARSEEFASLPWIPRRSQRRPLSRDVWTKTEDTSLQLETMLGDKGAFEEALEATTHVVEVEGMGDLVQHDNRELQIEEGVSGHRVGLAEKGAAIDRIIDGDDGVLLVEIGYGCFAEDTVADVAHLEVALVREAGECFADILDVFGAELADGLVAGVLFGDSIALEGNREVWRDVAYRDVGVGVGSV